MKTISYRLSAFVFLFSLFVIWLPGALSAESNIIFNLEDTVDKAIQANLGLSISQEEIKAAQAQKKSSRSAFLPAFSVAYQYERYDEELRSALFGVTRPQNEYTFAATVTQPVFTGFALLNQYRIAALGLDAAMLNERLVRRKIILAAQKVYFTILKALKLLKVAQERVTQIDAHKKVAKNFYEVGMTPLNDYLQAQVELANAHQGRFVAQNNLDLAEANFNTLLRRPLHEPVRLQDVLTFRPLQYDLASCFSNAFDQRIEIKIADLDTAIAAKQIKLAQKNFFPTISLQGTYFQIGNEWDLTGNTGVSDPDGWSLSAKAQWTLWEWGKSYYGVKEKRHRHSQAQQKQEDILDQIRLEVKQSFLKTQEAENNIRSVEKAIEQAKENFRINQERYKEQVATSTEVLDAQTLLSLTMTNYYNALYDFKIAKATLYYAMGREAIE